MKRSKKRLFVILIIIAIVIGLAVFFGIKIFQSNITVNLTKIEEKDIAYYKLKKEDKYGIIDKDGKVIIEPQYTDIAIPNPKIDLFICTESSDYNNKMWKAVDSNNTQKLSQFEDVEAIEINPLTSIVPYEKDILKYKEGNLYGLINLEGKKILPAEYEDIKNIDYKEGYLKVKKDGLYGVVTIDGKIIIKPNYFDINADGYYSNKTKYENGGFIIQMRTDNGYKYGYADKNGKVLFECTYNEIYRITENESENDAYIVSSYNGKYGLIKNDKTIFENEYDSIEYDSTTNLAILTKLNKQGISTLEGHLILPIEYEAIDIGGDYINAIKDNNREVFNEKGEKLQTTFVSHQKVNNNYAIVIDENNNYNIADSSNNLLLKQGYVYIEYFTNDLFIVTQGNNSGLINTNGNVVVPIQYSTLQRIGDKDLLQAVTAKNNKLDLINESGNISEGIENGAIEVQDNYIKLYSDKNVKYFDMSGNEKQYKDFVSNNSVYAASKNGKWGLVDKNGNVVVDYTYDMVTEQNGEVAGVKKGDLWRIVDTSGKIIVNPTYNLNWNNTKFLGTYYEQNGQVGDKIYSSDILQQ